MSDSNAPKIERKTYINGRLKGQYQGFETQVNNQGAFEKVYDLELIRGQVFAEEIIRWDEVDENQFIDRDDLKLKLPRVIKVNLISKGETLRFMVELKDIKTISYHLGNHQEDGGHMFGDITVNIFAYFVHDDDLTPAEIEERKRKSQESSELEAEPKVFTEKIQKTVGGYQTTIKKTASGRVNFTSTRLNDTWFDRFWSGLSSVFCYLILALILIPAIISGWPVFLGIAGIFFLIWAISIIFNFILRRRNWLWAFLGLVFGLFMLSNVLSLFRSNVIDQNETSESISPPPRTTTEKTDQLITGNIIKHELDWNDYDANSYQGTVAVKTKDWFNAKNIRNNIPGQAFSTEDYNRIVNNVYLGNLEGMEGVYHMFDSIIENVNPSKQQFAEIAVSCVQDIPYYLIVEGSCSPQDYPSNEYIHQYLLRSDDCVEHVKYGLLGPLEFVATLHGDCDTRTLLLYTILKHYQYNVIMLVSQPLQHAILAVELPRIDGKYFTFRNRRFVWWETTQPNIPPGLIPNEYANPNLWQVSLI